MGKNPNGPTNPPNPESPVPDQTVEINDPDQVNLDLVNEDPAEPPQDPDSQPEQE